jgi:hypothetical protein
MDKKINVSNDVYNQLDQPGVGMLKEYVALTATLDPDATGMSVRHPLP